MRKRKLASESKRLVWETKGRRERTMGEPERKRQTDRRGGRRGEGAGEKRERGREGEKEVAIEKEKREGEGGRGMERARKKCKDAVVYVSKLAALPALATYQFRNSVRWYVKCTFDTLRQSAELIE